MTDEITPIITPRTALRPNQGRGVLAEREFVAIDLETTGTSAAHRIVELGAARMAPDGTVLDRFSRIVNPGAEVPLPKSAERIHQISAHQIRSAQPLDEALDDFADFIGGSGVVAHSLAFENRFLSAAYQRRGRAVPQWHGLCTLTTSRRFVTSESHKLEVLLDKLGLPGVNSHRAAEDAEACGHLAAFLIGRLNVSALEPLPLSTHRPGPAAPSHTGVEESAIGLLRRELGATVVTGPPTPALRTAPIPPTAQPSTTPFTQTVPPTPAGPTVNTLLTGPGARGGMDLREAFGGHNPTAEQENAAHLYLTGGNLLIEALAGTGKSATLRACSRLDLARDPSREIDVVAFGKDIAKEAQRNAPPNTRARTMHALARQELNKTAHGPLLGKLNAERQPWRITAAAILPREVVVDTPGGRRLISSYLVGRYALGAVNEFCKTVDEQITAAHLPPIPGIPSGSQAHDQLADVVVPCAKRAWRHLLNPDSFAVRFDHGHYLKLFADTRPKIGRPGGVLMYDEAQDANPVTLQIVADQTHLQCVAVGDSAQAIMGFTGAVNALSHLPADHTATLTQSFRFGVSIAEAANVYLKKLGGRLTVRGNPSIDDVVDWSVTTVDAVLARTNAGALTEVISAQQSGRNAALLGDADSALQFCAVARQLQAGTQPEDPTYAAFSTWAELTEYTTMQPGVSELTTNIKLIDDYGIDAIEHALKRLVHPKRADFVASTAHRSKGLEFDRVKIADDFSIDEQQSPDSPHGVSANELANQYRLAYVALTRARTVLNPGKLLDRRQLSTQRAAPAGMLL